MTLLALFFKRLFYCLFACADRCISNGCLVLLTHSIVPDRPLLLVCDHEYSESEGAKAAGMYLSLIESL